ncbi:MAG: GNAT family N-acetyltransferase [Desulfobacterales bacterium]|nr:GNAT family N-acetyltransferase [Desulfobacterales bacterium]
MSEIIRRSMQKADWPEVADLIYVSTNYWYETHGMGESFTGGPSVTEFFCEVYESVDPGCCILAVNKETARIMGSCFYHPRNTHFSIGMVNVHPNYFRQGLAKMLLDFVINLADEQSKPLRLVSSAMNIDSFSLYTRSGFVPYALFQDMYIQVPETGLNITGSGSANVREATIHDASGIADLEMEISHVHRENDHRFFINSDNDKWHVSVYENDNGKIDGYLVSLTFPGLDMLGPGAARTSDIALALILAELNCFKNKCPLLLIPADDPELTRQMYALGAKNFEIHLAQVRGEVKPINGIVMPTFLPETW